MYYQNGGYLLEAANKPSQAYPHNFYILMGKKYSWSVINDFSTMAIIRNTHIYTQKCCNVLNVTI